MTDVERDPFVLQNAPQKPTLWKGEPTEKRRQTVLFSGMDCLPGQRDLFATDGCREDEDE